MLELAAWWWWAAAITPSVLTYALFGGGMIPPRQEPSKEPTQPSKHAEGQMRGIPEQFADAADAFVKSLPNPNTLQKEGGDNQ